MEPAKSGITESSQTTTEPPGERTHKNKLKNKTGRSRDNFVTPPSSVKFLFY